MTNVNLLDSPIAERANGELFYLRLAYENAIAATNNIDEAIKHVADFYEELRNRGNAIDKAEIDNEILQFNADCESGRFADFYNYYCKLNIDSIKTNGLNELLQIDGNTPSLNPVQFVYTKHKDGQMTAGIPTYYNKNGERVPCDVLVLGKDHLFDQQYWTEDDFLQTKTHKQFKALCEIFENSLSNGENFDTVRKRLIKQFLEFFPKETASLKQETYKNLTQLFNEIVSLLEKYNLSYYSLDREQFIDSAIAGHEENSESERE